MTAPASSIGRSPGLDAVRLAGLLAVVSGHVSATAFTARAVHSWHLPLFFVLAGYFMRPGRSVRDEADRRARTLLVPYAAWLVLVTAATLPGRSGVDVAVAADVVKDALLGGSYATRPYTTFWFFTALFVATVVYRALDRTPVAVRVAVVAGGLVATVLAGEQLARIPLSAGTALGTLFLLAAGRGVHELQQRLRRGPALAVAGTSLAAGALVLATVDDYTAPILKAGLLDPVSALCAVLVCGGLVLLAGAWTVAPGALTHVLAALVRPAVVVILLHPVVLYVVPPEEGRLAPVVLVAIAFLLPLAAGLVLQRTRLSAALTGVARTEQRRAAVPSQR